MRANSRESYRKFLDEKKQGLKEHLPSPQKGIKNRLWGIIGGIAWCAIAFMGMAVMIKTGMELSQYAEKINALTNKGTPTATTLNKTQSTIQQQQPIPAIPPQMAFASQPQKTAQISGKRPVEHHVSPAWAAQNECERFQHRIHPEGTQEEIQNWCTDPSLR